MDRIKSLSSTSTPAERARDKQLTAATEILNKACLGQLTPNAFVDAYRAEGITPRILLELIQKNAKDLSSNQQLLHYLLKLYNDDASFCEAVPVVQHEKPGPVYEGPRNAELVAEKLTRPDAAECKEILGLIDIGRYPIIAYGHYTNPVLAVKDADLKKRLTPSQANWGEALVVTDATLQSLEGLTAPSTLSEFGSRCVPKKAGVQGKALDPLIPRIEQANFKRLPKYYKSIYNLANADLASIGHAITHDNPACLTVIGDIDVPHNAIEDSVLVIDPQAGLQRVDSRATARLRYAQVVFVVPSFNQHDSRPAQLHVTFILGNSNKLDEHLYSETETDLSEYEYLLAALKNDPGFFAQLALQQVPEAFVIDPENPRQSKTYWNPKSEKPSTMLVVAPDSGVQRVFGGNYQYFYGIKS
jgi:hypothetical protein